MMPIGFSQTFCDNRDWHNLEDQISIWNLILEIIFRTSKTIPAIVIIGSRFVYEHDRQLRVLSLMTPF